MSRKHEQIIKAVLSNWIRLILDDKNISMRDIFQVIIDYYAVVEQLRFSKFLATHDLRLWDDRKCVTNGRTGHRFIVVDIEPVKSGVHCWRAKIHKSYPSAWLLVGVSEKRKFICTSYEEGMYLYGVKYE